MVSITIREWSLVLGDPIYQPIRGWCMGRLSRFDWLCSEQIQEIVFFLPRPIGVVTGNKHNNPLLRYHFRIRSEKIYDLWLTTFFFVVETWGCFNKISQETKPLTDYHCWFGFVGKVYRFCHAFLTNKGLFSRGGSAVLYSKLKRRYGTTMNI